MRWIANKTIDHDLIIQLLEQCEKTNQFTNGGPNVALLEREIRKLFQVSDNKSVIAVTNGYAAIKVATAAISRFKRKTMKWATQAFTFPPSAQISPQKVVIIDVDKEGGVDLSKIDDTIDGIIVTNVFGHVVDIDKYIQFCNERDIALLFDNAATAYTFYKGSNSINYGTGSIISFHHTKPFGFGEGGAIIIDTVYEKYVRCLINFGIGLTDQYWTYDGGNYKMSDISAAYIIQYLKNNFETIIKHHQKLYQTVVEYIEQQCEIKIYPSFHSNVIVPSSICILLEEPTENIVEHLITEGIEVRRYYHPLDTSKQANYVWTHIICIPCNVDISCKDMSYILDRICQRLKLM